MSVEFAPSEIAGGKSEYSRAYDAARGTDLRRMVTGRGSSFAVVDLMSTVGDHVFYSSALRTSLGAMLGADLVPSWGESGTLHEGAVSTDWQGFELQPGDLRCMGLKRELRLHPEAGAAVNAAQAMVVGFLCRKRPAMTDRDAARLSSALRTRI
jgi:hypothetical protein